MKHIIGGVTLKGLVAEKFEQGHFEYHWLELRLTDLANRRLGLDTRLNTLKVWLSQLETFEGEWKLKDYEIEYFTI